MKVMVLYFVSDTGKVMTALVCVVFVFVSGIHTMVTFECYCGFFPAISQVSYLEAYLDTSS
jgi:hypothetical protein